MVDQSVFTPIHCNTPGWFILLGCFPKTAAHPTSVLGTLGAVRLHNTDCLLVFVLFPSHFLLLLFLSPLSLSGVLFSGHLSFSVDSSNQTPEENRSVRLCESEQIHSRGSISISKTLFRSNYLFRRILN